MASGSLMLKTFGAYRTKEPAKRTRSALEYTSNDRKRLDSNLTIFLMRIVQSQVLISDVRVIDGVPVRKSAQQWTWVFRERMKI